MCLSRWLMGVNVVNYYVYMLHVTGHVPIVLSLPVALHDAFAVLLLLLRLTVYRLFF